MGCCVSRKREKKEAENKCCVSLENRQDNSRCGESVWEAKHISSVASGPVDQVDSADSGNRNQDVIYSMRTQINLLLVRINQFEGTTDQDQNYRYLDEMLTRCILSLDGVECSTVGERSQRKEAIRGANEAISLLERRLKINLDLKELRCNLTTQQ